MTQGLLITLAISRVESVVKNNEPLSHTELMISLSKNCMVSEVTSKRAIKFWTGAGHLQIIDGKYYWVDEPPKADDAPVRISVKAKNSKITLNPDWWTSLLQAQA